MTVSAASSSATTTSSTSSTSDSSRTTLSSSDFLQLLVSELRTYLKTKADERPSARRAAKTSSTTAAA